MWFSLVLLLLTVLCCAACADAPLLGMGRRHYLGEGRLDIEYTTGIGTPHIDWADPYSRGPLSAFVVPSVMEGRTLVELMQRLSMEVDAVTIDPAWDVNKWTMSFGDAYGARSEQEADASVDYSFVYKYLEEDLTSDRSWDVMLTHGILGWGHLPPSIREAILKRVRAGMGLVLIGPLCGPEDGAGLAELSPLIPAAGAEDPQAVKASAWKAGSPHYITSGVPVETLPAECLRHRRYRAADNAVVLASAGNTPVMAAWQVGRGRVVALGYDNYGLAPLVRWETYGSVGDSWWETWYSLLIRCLLWAGRKEPDSRIDRLALSDPAVSASHSDPVRAAVRLSGEVPATGRLLWQVRSDGGQIECAGEAAVSGKSARLAIPVSELPGGRHLVDVFLVEGDQRLDWATASLVVRPPVRIAAVRVSPSVVEQGRRARVTVGLSRPLPKKVSLVVELLDNYRRVIARDQQPKLSSDRRTGSATLSSDDLLTHIGWVRSALYREKRMLEEATTRVALATPPEGRAWDDYEVNLPFYGPHSYYHWMPLLDDQYRRAGMTWLMEPERNFKFSVIARPPGLGVYYYDRKPFEEQMAAYWRTGDRKYLERNPCLHRDWRQTARRQMSQAMKPYLGYRPFHYYIYDEPSLTSYTRPFDFCYSRETVAAFREWLRERYESLAALNRQWGTTYRQWRQVEPPTTEEAQRENRVPAWADFRRFMDLTFADAFRYTQQVVEEIDPGALTLVGGTQRPTPFNGTDWWLLSHSFGILEPYFGIDHFRSFNPGLPLIQACGYGSEGPELENEIWRRALQGQRGATIFWNYTFHDPDLVLNSQGEAMARAFGALRGEGIARLLFGARRDDSRIAILHSQMSLYAAWIQDGDIRSGRSQAAERFHNSWQGWQRVLHRLGLQYRWVSYQQLADQGLSPEEFDVLVLPHTIALSAAEITAVQEFAGTGGIVVGDGEPGKFNEHCTPRSGGPFAEARGIHLISASPDDIEAFVAEVEPWLKLLLGEAGVEPTARVTNISPQVVHYVDGQAEYIGIVDAPAEAHRVELRRRAYIYDVRRRRYLGHSDHIQVTDGQGGVAFYALLPAPVAGVEVGVPVAANAGDLVTYRAEVDSGAAAVRRVFAVRVYSPDGELRHMYGGNVEAPSGSGEGAFRLALNDPAGEWRVVAVDAATGESGEARFVVSHHPDS
jgi:hypothetical protein